MSLNGFVFLTFVLCSNLSFGVGVKVTNSLEFKHALHAAKPGDSIEIAPDAVIAGSFSSSQTGISIIGPGCIQAEGINPALYIAGSNWILKDLKFRSSSPSYESALLLISGYENMLDSLFISGVKKGVQISGYKNTLQKSMIGVVNGTGVELTGSENKILSTTIVGSKLGNSCAENLETDQNSTADFYVSGTRNLLDTLEIAGKLLIAGCENILNEVHAVSTKVQNSPGCMPKDIPVNNAL